MSTTADDLPTAFEADFLVKKGLCPVTKLRHQGPEVLESHSLYYEQHGRGSEYKVLFIMGLNSSAFAWGPQVRHFSRSESHTFLVYDNRGVGNSTCPRGPYSTAGMAEDAIDLLDHVGWTGDRSVHVVGMSLGGMIAQELATRIPQRIASLTLVVTTPGDLAEKAPRVMEMLFPIAWLNEKAKDDPQGRTNREIQTEAYIRRMSITRPQQLMGHISQMLAGFTHRVTPERLRIISKSIPKVTIVTGDEDNLILPQHSLDIKACMPEAEFVQWQGTGHGIHVQQAEMLNALFERTFKEGKERCERVSAH